MRVLAEGRALDGLGRGHSIHAFAFIHVGGVVRSVTRKMDLSENFVCAFCV